MRILVLDSAPGRVAAAVIADDVMLASRAATLTRGQEGALPGMAEAVMAEAGGGIALIGVTVGPGSFTGIRAVLALAHGIGLGLGVPVIGVTAGEAMAAAFPHLGQRRLWTVTTSRRGHVFLERDGGAVSVALDDLPQPAGKVAIAGEAASRAAAHLAARDVDVMLTNARSASPRSIARVALARHQGRLPPRDAQPLYVDPPEAKPPAGGLRPPPAASA